MFFKRRQITEQMSTHTYKGPPASNKTEKDSLIPAEENSIYNLKIIG